MNTDAAKLGRAIFELDEECRARGLRWSLNAGMNRFFVNTTRAASIGRQVSGAGPEPCDAVLEAVAEVRKLGVVAACRT